MRNRFTLRVLSILITYFVALLLPFKASSFAIPKAPHTLNAVAFSPSQITLTWIDASLDETGFELERSTDGKIFVKIADVAVNIVIYQSTGLSASTPYWYRIRAKNATGFSAYSNIATATTKPPLVTIPKAPDSLNAAGFSPSQITLTWVDASLDETGFELERSSDGKVFAKIADVAANVVIYQNSGLPASTPYWYRIRAKNTAGFSAYSNVATAATKPPLITIPKAPSDLAGTAVSISQINVNWLDNATDETGFQLERSLNGTAFTKIADLGANVTTYPNTGLSTFTTYYYRVRALNTAGASAYSNVISVTTQNIPVPDQPVNFTAVPLAHNLIQLRWSPLTGNAAEVVVERSKGSDEQFVQIHKQAASVIQYEDKEALAMDDYYYRIKAVNAGGSSPYSLIAIVRAASIITSIEPAEDGNLIYVSGKTLMAELKNNIPSSLHVYDLNGSERKKRSIGQSSQTDLNSLPAGIYVVVIQRDKEVITRKIVLY